jgi:outer membrane immunogenic protein
MLQRFKLALTAGLLLGLGASGTGSAADLAVKARPMAVVNPYNWNGCYVGGNVGGAWTRTDTTLVQSPVFGPITLNYGRERADGFIGGGQVGCDFQTGNLVFGIVGEFDFGNVNGRHAVTDVPGFTETNSLKEVYTIGGRVGYLWTPQFLGYVKGGAAFLRERNSVFTPGGGLFERSSFVLPGMTAGIGGEWMFAPNWSVFAEYNWIWFEDDAAHSFAPVGEVFNIRQRAQTALIGVNYKFHWDGPVVAKY